MIFSTAHDNTQNGLSEGNVTMMSFTETTIQEAATCSKLFLSNITLHLHIFAS